MEHDENHLMDAVRYAMYIHMKNKNKPKKIGYWRFIVNNIKFFLVFTGVLALFIIYWLVFPDATSQQAIRITFYAWLILTAGILGGAFLQWIKK